MKHNTVITPAESRRGAIRRRKTKRRYRCLALPRQQRAAEVREKKQNIRRALETQTTAAIRIYSSFICVFSWHLLTRSNMKNSLCCFCKGFLYPRRILRLSHQCAAAPVLIITSSRTYCVSANCR